MIRLSFIISSIGKSDRLDHLINQIDSMFYNKEIILVDNSRNKLLYKKYYKSSKCRYIYEGNQGTSYARNTGAKEAKNEMLIFLDDDIVLSDNFRNIDFLSLYKDEKFGIAGGKIIVSNKPKYLPKKYTYLAGEKDFGNKLINMPSYHYLGGCLLIIKKKTFDLFKGFDVQFGHQGNIIGANEDIIFQELIRKAGLKVVYIPEATVYHFWNENEAKALERVRKQGIVDRMTDEKYFKSRMILKLVKYKIFIFIFKNNKKLSKEMQYDLERYKSYVNSK